MARGGVQWRWCHWNVGLLDRVELIDKRDPGHESRARQKGAETSPSTRLRFASGRLELSHWQPSFSEGRKRLCMIEPSRSCSRMNFQSALLPSHWIAPFLEHPPQPTVPCCRLYPCAHLPRDLPPHSGAILVSHPHRGALRSGSSDRPSVAFFFSVWSPVRAALCSTSD